MLKRTLITTAAAALLPAAAQAKPAVLHYQGKTKEGTKISFVVDHGWVDQLLTSLPTTCASAQGGTPRVTISQWTAPFKYRLGAKAKVDHGDPTRQYRVSTHRRKRGRVTGRLSINYSQLVSSLGGGYYIDTCLATASFSLRPKR